MTEISGQDLTKLAKELVKAFNFNSLSTAVQSSTGDPLYLIVGQTDAGLGDVMVTLLNRLSENDTPLVAFLRYVHVNRPGKPALRALIEELCPEAVVVEADPEPGLSLQKAGKRLAGTGRADTPGLQSNVKPWLQKIDVGLWLAGLERARRTVCRVTVDGAAAGTGFLVGPDAVLTNWHVVHANSVEPALRKIACQFDYLLNPDGTRPASHNVSLAKDGLKASAPFSPAETTADPDTPAPTGGELDYALLQLADRVGDAEDGGRKRGWLPLPAAAASLAKGAPLMIVQHPDGAPMKLALDTESVIGLAGEGRRLRYATNTEGGSSGSPCFDMDWSLVALHHYGDPTWGNPKFNQGVPIHLIRADIESKGSSMLLGA